MPFTVLCCPSHPTTPIPHQRKMLRRHRALQEACAQDPLAEVAELPPIPPESERELASLLPPSLLAVLSCDFSIVCTGMLSCTCTIVALLHSLTYVHIQTQVHAHAYTHRSLFPPVPKPSPPGLFNEAEARQRIWAHYQQTRRPLG